MTAGPWPFHPHNAGPAGSSEASGSWRGTEGLPEVRAKGRVCSALPRGAGVRSWQILFLGPLMSATKEPPEDQVWLSYPWWSRALLPPPLPSRVASCPEHRETPRSNSYPLEERVRLHPLSTWAARDSPEATQPGGAARVQAPTLQSARGPGPPPPSSHAGRMPASWAWAAGSGESLWAGGLMGRFPEGRGGHLGRRLRPSLLTHPFRCCGTDSWPS